MIVMIGRIHFRLSVKERERNENDIKRLRYVSISLCAVI